VIVAVQPITRNAARAFIREHHRHSRPPHGWLFGAALLDEAGALLAVGCAGRPKARMLQNGTTVEITRVCSTAPVAVNACSRLYGALCRAAAALGYERAVTYTHATEPGTSLRAAGFVAVAKVDGEDWSRRRRPRVTHDTADKVRWERAL